VLPQSGLVLDVGSCDATYLSAIQGPDRHLECLDPRDCAHAIPPGANFHRASLFGNPLPRARYDAVLMISVMEHLGLPTYGQSAMPHGDRRALAECWSLLRPRGILVATFPAGWPKVTSWYRQYSPARIERLFAGWDYDVRYWGISSDQYVEIAADDVLDHDYRDRLDGSGGAGAVAGVIARRG
jgi:SAM-dependent methyltransferase